MSNHCPCKLGKLTKHQLQPQRLVLPLNVLLDVLQVLWHLSVVLLSLAVLSASLQVVKALADAVG